tara:strand:- start:258 stop:503 length:246 start_codon:yes stop_codon:yes gene_type:complete
MIDTTTKFLIGLLALSFSGVAIQLIPLSKLASSWNRCIEKTSGSLSQVKAIKKLDNQSKEVLSVMICNGAVFEPNLKINTP